MTSEEIGWSTPCVMAITSTHSRNFFIRLLWFQIWTSNLSSILRSKLLHFRKTAYPQRHHTIQLCHSWSIIYKTNFKHYLQNEFSGIISLYHRSVLLSHDKRMTTTNKPIKVPHSVALMNFKFQTSFLECIEYLFRLNLFIYCYGMAKTWTIHKVPW